MSDTTFTQVEEGSLGRLRFKIVDVVLSSSYPTGGEPLSGAQKQLGLNIVGGLIVGGNATAGGYKWHFDTANLKLMAHRAAGFTPAGTVAAPTFTGSALGNHVHDLLYKNAAVADGATTRVNVGANLLGANTGSDITVTGAGANGGVRNASAGTPAGTNSAPAFTGTAVAAAALSEVANATDLHTSTVRILFLGY